MIHGSLLRGVAMYPRIATPYTVFRCHCLPSPRPNGERAPSATMSDVHPISAPESNNRDETRPAES